VFQALYNYDTMKGNPAIEKAMLDAMALFPETLADRRHHQP
jgi:hypothetical protein